MSQIVLRSCASECTTVLRFEVHFNLRAYS